MTLKTQLLVRIALVLAATLIIGAGLIAWHARFKVATEMHAAFEVGNRIMANAIAEERSIADPRRYLGRLITTFDGDRHIRASLLGADGVPILESRLPPPDVVTPGWLYSQLAGNRLATVVPLPIDLRQEGSLILEADSRNEVAEAVNDARVYLLILAGFCGSVALLLHESLHHALTPLQALTQACERIGNGDYGTRVDTSPQTAEMAHLAGGFNAMACRLASAEARNERLREQLEKVQEEERAELARNLHDEVSPLLFSVDVDATTIRRLADASATAAIATRAEAILLAVSEMKSNVRGVLSQLRPEPIAALPLQEALEYRVAVWSARHPAVTVALHRDTPRGQAGTEGNSAAGSALGPRPGYGTAVDVAVQTIVREAVSNALKHGHPSRIDIEIHERTPGRLSVAITDDGGGILPGATTRGYGIIGMIERVRKLGGRLDYGNSPDGFGAVIVADLPVHATPGRPLQLIGTLHGALGETRDGTLNGTANGGTAKGAHRDPGPRDPSPHDLGARGP